MPKIDKHEGERRKHRKKSRSRSKSPSSRLRHAEKEPRRTKDDIRAIHETEDVSRRGGGATSSLSVEETNKIRAKLGLAPLQVGSTAPIDGPSGTSKASSDNFVHAPAKNVTEAKKSEALKEKISTMRDKRHIIDKLREVKSLGEGEEIEALTWVEQMRSKEKLRKEAEKRAKMLSEMDEQFGVSDLVSSELQKPKSQTYLSADLHGLKVEHSITRFHEERPIILTLKDKDILAEDGDDVLVNVNIVDDEKADKNRENKRNTAGFGGAMQDEAEDVLLGLRAKGVLEKYDAEIDGEKKNDFTLGSTIGYHGEQELALQRLREELQSGKQSVAEYELRVASEYYSPTEMENFKKRKRRVKVTRQKLTAADLANTVPLPSNSTANRDHGCRRSYRSGKEAHVEEPEEGEVDDHDTSLSHAKATTALQLDEGTGINPAVAAALEANTVGEQGDADDKWETEPDEPDDMRLELEKVLERVRKANAFKEIPSNENANRLQPIKAEDESQETVAPSSNGVVFDATAEFYKQISNNLTEANNLAFAVGSKMPQVPTDDFLMADIKPKSIKPLAYKSDDSMSADEDEEVPSNKKMEDKGRRWQMVGDTPKKRNKATASGVQHKRRDDTTEELEPLDFLSGVLDDEPQLNKGVFSALRFAEKKGYVEKNEEKDRPLGSLVNLMAKNCVQEDVRYDDIDAKFSKRARYTGSLSEFRDKSDYKPDVQLQYVDDNGRLMNEKEAFRQLSHKFHGKGSGKKKTEKRVKKIKEDVLVKAAASSDTPLGTVNKLNKKLQRQGLPYVVLSGKNAVTKKLTK